MPRGRALLESQVGDGVDQDSNNYRVMNVGVSHSEIMSDRILVGLFHPTSRKSGEVWQFHGCQLAIEV
jgi:hypothetical protein